MEWRNGHHTHTLDPSTILNRRLALLLASRVWSVPPPSSPHAGQSAFCIAAPHAPTAKGWPFEHVYQRFAPVCTYAVLGQNDRRGVQRGCLFPRWILRGGLGKLTQAHQPVHRVRRPLRAPSAPCTAGPLALWACGREKGRKRGVKHGFGMRFAYVLIAILEHPST